VTRTFTQRKLCEHVLGIDKLSGVGFGNGLLERAMQLAPLLLVKVVTTMGEAPRASGAWLRWRR
jgi:hypothetical protein